MPYQKGQSGNPNGRPVKNRALTAILEASGSKAITAGDKRVARKRVLADLLWQVATTGRATMPDGSTLDASPGDWFGVVQFLYRHIDGPPPQTVKHQGDEDSPVVIRMTWGENEKPDADPAPTP